MPKYPEYKVSIINLSSHHLADTKYRQLKFGLNHSFINKDVKKDIATHMESLAYTASKSLIQDQNIVILQGDKDSSVIKMDKSDYTHKLEDMIEEGISKGTYERTDDTTL